MTSHDDIRTSAGGGSYSGDLCLSKCHSMCSWYKERKQHVEGRVVWRKPIGHESLNVTGVHSCIAPESIAQETASEWFHSACSEL